MSSIEIITAVTAKWLLRHLRQKVRKVFALSALRWTETIHHKIEKVVHWITGGRWVASMQWHVSVAVGHTSVGRSVRRTVTVRSSPWRALAAASYCCSPPADQYYEML